MIVDRRTGVIGLSHKLAESFDQGMWPFPDARTHIHEIPRTQLHAILQWLANVAPKENVADYVIECWEHRIKEELVERKRLGINR